VELLVLQRPCDPTGPASHSGAHQTGFVIAPPSSLDSFKSTRLAKFEVLSICIGYRIEQRVGDVAVRSPDNPSLSGGPPRLHLSYRFRVSSSKLLITDVSPFVRALCTLIVR
jgi:hypothetical protein